MSHPRCWVRYHDHSKDIKLRGKTTKPELYHLILQVKLRFAEVKFVGLQIFVLALPFVFFKPCLFEDFNCCSDIQQSKVV